MHLCWWYKPFSFFFSNIENFPSTGFASHHRHKFKGHLHRIIVGSTQCDILCNDLHSLQHAFNSPKRRKTKTKLKPIDSIRLGSIQIRFFSNQKFKKWAENDVTVTEGDILFFRSFFYFFFFFTFYTKNRHFLLAFSLDYKK